MNEPPPTVIHRSQFFQLAYRDETIISPQNAPRLVEEWLETLGELKNRCIGDSVRLGRRLFIPSYIQGRNFLSRLGLARLLRRIPMRLAWKNATQVSARRYRI